MPDREKVILSATDVKKLEELLEEQPQPTEAMLALFAEAQPHPASLPPSLRFQNLANVAEMAFQSQAVARDAETEAARLAGAVVTGKNQIRQ